MEKDDLMEDSSSESDKEEDENNLSSIFNDPYATTYITSDGKKRWDVNGVKKTLRYGTQPKRCIIWYNAERLT